MKEIWKTIKEDEFYQASNLGRIRSIDRPQYRSDGSISHYKKGKILKTKDNGHGYKCVTIRRPNNFHYVHRLVLGAFNPIENMAELEVNHKDGNKANNELKNLEWCTKSENMQHAYTTKLKPKGDDCSYAKVKFSEIEEMRRLRYNEHISVTKIAEKFGLSHQYVSRLTRGIQRKDG